jgi:hypothetical protein
MAIVFFCQSCGARFEVDARMAGKKGRCRKCGQMMVIPRAENLASMVAMPALASAAVGPAARATSDPAAPSAAAWLKAASSNVGLAPLTVDRVPISVRRGSAPSPLDDAEDSKPYGLVKPTREERRRSRGKGPANVLVRLWKRETGAIQKVFRWLNESAYLISIPFLMVLLAGVALRNRPVALFGATIVVLLNLGRIVAGVANLVVVPLRDGLNAKKLKKPVRRIIEPVLTIGAVIVAFTFIPWLSNNGPSSGTLADRLRTGTTSLEEEIKGEVNTVEEKARTLDVKQLEAQAQEKLKQIGRTGSDDETKKPQP